MAWKYLDNLARDPENRSRKTCCCGGHNLGNVKSDLYHHSTRAKLKVRKARRRRELDKRGMDQ